MRAYLTLCLLGVSAGLWGQPTVGKPTSGSQSAVETFTSPDGAFEFKYPSFLIHCEQRTQQTGDGHYWVQEACGGYGGVCDDLADPNPNTLVCFAYPRNQHTNTPAFQAAAFAVAVTGQVRAEDCLAGSPNWNVDRIEKPAKIGGFSFNVFETSDAGMNQAIATTVYRTFHGQVLPANHCDGDRQRTGI